MTDELQTDAFQTDGPQTDGPHQTGDHPMKRFDITGSEIDRVVTLFYIRIRAHPELGPIFARYVADADWPAHEARVADFWANSILHERSYDGSPMAAHIKAGNVKPGMFSTWLDLFDATLRVELPPEKAVAWSALAHRIGRSLRAGVMQTDALQPGVERQLGTGK